MIDIFCTLDVKVEVGLMRMWEGKAPAAIPTTSNASIIVCL